MQVGEEQAELARQYAAEQGERLTRRVNLCRLCKRWGDFWRCAKLPDEKTFRKALRKGHCPEGIW